VLLREANAVTDNPLVLSATTHWCRAAIFHAEPVALTADACAMAIAEVGRDRRTAHRDADRQRGSRALPPFLTGEADCIRGSGGSRYRGPPWRARTNRGAPGERRLAADLANQEDHVSMACFAARRLQR